jgi:hypothetical protein
MRKKNYHDKCLESALGLLAASLRADNVSAGVINDREFGPPKIYSDALESALREYSREISDEHGWISLVDRMAGELGDRGLSTIEGAFLEHQDFAAFVAIVKEDLNRLFP